MVSDLALLSQEEQLALRDMIARYLIRRGTRDVPGAVMKKHAWTREQAILNGAKNDALSSARVFKGAECAYEEAKKAMEAARPSYERAMERLAGLMAEASPEDLEAIGLTKEALESADG